MNDEKSEAQKITDYLLEHMTQEQKDNIPLVFTEYKFDSLPKKLNVTWSQSKWSINGIDESVFGKHMVWYEHKDGIRLPYLRNRLLNMFVLNVIGRVFCFFKGVKFE